jgi:hypothetical protein
MVSPSTTTLPSSSPNDWCQLVQGLFLATLGVLLLSAGMQEQTLSAIPADSLPGHRIAREARTTLITPPVPTQGRAMRAWGQVWVGTEEVVFANQGKPRRPADCLGADLATGQRAESNNLATIPLQRPGECGDLRDVLLMMESATQGATVTAGVCRVRGTALRRTRPTTSIWYPRRCSVHPTGSQRRCWPLNFWATSAATRAGIWSARQQGSGSCRRSAASWTGTRRVAMAQ